MPANEEMNKAENSNKIKTETAEGQSIMDKDLSDLLDNFGKNRSSEDTGTTTKSSSDANMNLGFMDQASAQKAAQDFQTMLSQLAQMQQSVVEQMDPVKNSNVSGKNIDSNEDEDFSSDQARAILQSITSFADRTSKVAQAPNEEEFLREMQNLQTDDDTQFMPLMAGLMAGFLSKEMLYPPIKEMVEKYPGYMDINRDKLDKDTLDRYEKQLEIMIKVCHEFEQDLDEDDQEMMTSHLETVTQLMQQMQLCGYPPEELVGNLPPGWSFDSSTGMPKLENAKQSMESCSVM